MRTLLSPRGEVRARRLPLSSILSPREEESHPARPASERDVVVEIGRLRRPTFRPAAPASAARCEAAAAPAGGVAAGVGFIGTATAAAAVAAAVAHRQLAAEALPPHHRRVFL